MPTVSDSSALLSGDSWNGIDIAAAPVIVTFSFPDTLPFYDASIGGFTVDTVASYAAFTAAEQTQAIAALGQWAAASGIVFLQVAPGQGDINFGNVAFSTTIPGSENGDYTTAGGIGFYPFGLSNFFTGPYFETDQTTAGDIFMNSAYQNLDGTVNAGTLLHEIGHALGLKHPLQTVVDALGVTHDQVLTSDDQAQTIMATVGDGSSGASATLKPLDMEAAASLYGPAGTGGVYTTPITGANSIVDWTWDPATNTLFQTAAAGAKTIHGTSANDVITGNDNGDALFGLGGDDFLKGGAGSDSLYGGSGNDTLAGGGGNDSYYVLSADDLVVEQGSSGNDAVYASVSYTTPANVELLQISGPGLTATANDQGNTLFGDGFYASRLIGGAGSDYIAGGDGNDTISGGGGIDQMFGDDGNDVFVFTKVSDALAGQDRTTIRDFTPGADTIDLSGITASDGSALSFSPATVFSRVKGEVIAVVDPDATANTILEGDVNGDGIADFQIELRNVTTVHAADLVIAAACYCAGTRIATDRGDVAIEALAIGDHVRTEAGASRPIRWLGHRRINTASHPDPASVWPFLVIAGAFGTGLPARNLWLSPEHHVAVGDALVPIYALANGRTVLQVPVPVVEYWHLELESHDIILAEQLGAESYLDVGNRSAFSNGAEFTAAHPELTPKQPRDLCRPAWHDGPIVRGAKAALLAHAASFGEILTSDDELHAMADGRRVEPLALADRRRAFVLPERTASIRLRSRSFVPAEIDPDNSDTRRLGICVARLQLDGGDIALDDEALFADGWHALEIDPDGARRWSNGEFAVPAGTRLVVVDLDAPGRYWQERDDNVVTLFS